MKKINVCYASSNEYSQYTSISIYSMLKNNNEIIDVLYLLSFGIEEKNQSIIENICKSFNVKIIIIDALQKIQNLVYETHLQLFEGSYATYARAFISRIIDGCTGLLLYVDSDTIVNGSLLDLLNLDMSSYAYAGVVGMNQYYPGCQERILSNGNAVYYACGVMLFNIDNWKKLLCTEKIIDFLKTKREAMYIYADQTVINNVVPEEYATKLDLVYNYWGHMFRGRRILYELSRGGFYSKKEIQDAINNPIIIHYKGLIVHPWLIGNKSSLEDVFLRYKSETPWKNTQRKSIYYDDSTCSYSKNRKKVIRGMKKYISRSYLSVRLLEFAVVFKKRLKKEFV